MRQAVWVAPGAFRPSRRGGTDSAQGCTSLRNDPPCTSFNACHVNVQLLSASSLRFAHQRGRQHKVPPPHTRLAPGAATAISPRAVAAPGTMAFDGRYVKPIQRAPVYRGMSYQASAVRDALTGHPPSGAASTPTAQPGQPGQAPGGSSYAVAGRNVHQQPTATHMRSDRHAGVDMAPSAGHADRRGADQFPQGTSAPASRQQVIKHYATSGMVYEPDEVRRVTVDLAPAGSASARRGGQPSGPVGKESYGINAIPHRGRQAQPNAGPGPHDRHARGWIRYHLPDTARPGIRPTHGSAVLQTSSAAAEAIFGEGTSTVQGGRGHSPASHDRTAPNPGRRLQSSEQTASALMWPAAPEGGDEGSGPTVRDRGSYTSKNLTSTAVAESLVFDPAAHAGGRPGQDGFDPAVSVRNRGAFVSKNLQSAGVGSLLGGGGLVQEGGAQGGHVTGPAPITATAQQLSARGGAGSGKRTQHYQERLRSSDGILQADDGRYFVTTHQVAHTGAQEGPPRAQTPPKRGKRHVRSGPNNPYRQTWVFG